MNLTLPLLIYRHWAQRASICSRRFANSTPNCEAAMNRRPAVILSAILLSSPPCAQFSISKIINSIIEGRKEREREEKPTNQPTNRRPPSLLFHRKGIQWFAILFESRFCNGTSSYRVNILQKIYSCHRQGGNEGWGQHSACFAPSLGVDGRWTANFVRYTVEIFSLDLSWKARVNEFGKGLVNIRWLLNLCTRVNKYCACGTQEIREPEIVPAIYTHIRVFLILFF